MRDPSVAVGADGVTIWSGQRAGMRRVSATPRRATLCTGPRAEIPVMASSRARGTHGRRNWCTSRNGASISSSGRPRSRASSPKPSAQPEGRRGTMSYLLYHDKGFQLFLTDAAVLRSGLRGDRCDHPSGERPRYLIAKDETATRPKKNLRISTSDSIDGMYSDADPPFTPKGWRSKARRRS